MGNFLVVGGTKGIGRYIVSKLLKNPQNHLWVVARNQPAESIPDRITFLQADATKDDISGFLPDVVDGLVYCAGSITLKPFHALKRDQIEQDLQVNYFGAVTVLQAAFKALKKSGNASVVLFSTVAVRTGMNFHSSIASAKGALEGLGMSLAAEWARYGIRVNMIAPSLTDTPLAVDLLSTEEKRKASEERHPLKRIGKPSQIAGLASYLLSSDGSFTTGQVLTADGGISSVKS